MINLSSAVKEQLLGLPTNVFQQSAIWVGLSFYILRSLSFLFDIYRKRVKYIGGLTIYFMYILFFPLVIAGPVEKAHEFIARLKKSWSISWFQISAGSQLILWGLFKKAVIADNMGLVVDGIFNNNYQHSGLVLLISLYFYSFQIYFDFSGYSDVAIGLAYTLGFSVTQNFNSPYLALSIIDFWKRWHISLTNWLREYIYLPLGGNRVGTTDWIRNILIVFFFSGLWHGLKATFLLWAMLHAVAYMITAYLTKKSTFNNTEKSFFIKQNEKTKYNHAIVFNWRRIFNLLLTFNLVSLFWLPFRADSLVQTWQIFSRIVADMIIRPLAGQLKPLTLINSGYTKRFLLVWGLIIVFALALDYFRRENLLVPKKVPTWLKWGLLYVLIFGLVFFSQMEPQQFIYARY